MNAIFLWQVTTDSEFKLSSTAINMIYSPMESCEQNFLGGGKSALFPFGGSFKLLN